MNVLTGVVIVLAVVFVAPLREVATAQLAEIGVPFRVGVVAFLAFSVFTNGVWMWIARRRR